MKRWVIAGVVVAVGAPFFWALWAAREKPPPQQVPFGMTGKPAPAFELVDLVDGGTHSLEALRGTPVVLNFWASWCQPCKVEHPYLEWAHRRYGDKVRFLGLIYEDTEDNARRFLASHASGYPQLLDTHSATAVSYGVAGVPETYFVRTDGTIQGKHVGPIGPQQLTENIESLLAVKETRP